MKNCAKNPQKNTSFSKKSENSRARNVTKNVNEFAFVEMIKNAKITTDFESTDAYKDEQTQSIMIAGYIVNQLETDGLIIRYEVKYDHPECKPSQTVLFDDNYHSVDIIKMDFIVVDDNGDELYESDINDIILDNTKITDFDLSLLGSDDVININDEDSDIDTITVRRENGLDIKFNGKIIAYVSSEREDYYKNPGRWTELTLYKTEGGKYICEQIGITQHIGERTRCTADICETLDDVIQFFGTKWLAKKLFEKAGIETNITVE